MRLRTLMRLRVGLPSLALVAAVALACDGSKASTGSTAATSPPGTAVETATVAAVPTAATVSNAPIPFVAVVTGSRPTYPKELVSFALGYTADWVVPLDTGARLVAVVGERVLVSEGESLRQFDLHTGAERGRFYEDGYSIFEVAVSPDSARIAVTTYPDDGCLAACAGRAGGSLRLLDARTGEVTFELASDDPRIADGIGAPGDVFWLSNSLLVLRLARFSGSVGSAHVINVTTGAAATVAGPLLEVSEGAGLGALGLGGRVACSRWEGVEVRDLQSGKRVFSLDGHGDALSLFEFSPDGLEMLIERESWGGAPPPRTCVDEPNTKTYSVVDLKTGVVTVLSDPESRRRAWYGADFLSWDCPPSLSFRRGNSSFSCNGTGYLVRGGVPILDATDVQVVWLDP